MSENDGQTVEEIVLELKTNFDEVIGRGMTAYSAFERNIGSVSRSIQSSVNAMHSQVTSNMGAMLSESQDEMNKIINGTRGAMRKVQEEGNRLSRAHIKALESLDSLRNKASDAMSNDSFTPEEKQGKLLDFGDQLLREADKIKSDMNKRLGSIASNASNTLVSSAQNSLQGVKESVKGILKELRKANSDISKIGSTSSVVEGSDALNKAEEQMKIIVKTVKAQGAQVVAAEKEMMLARKALLNQTSDAVKAKNEENYRNTLANLHEVNKAYQRSEREVAKAVNRVKAIKDSMSSGASDVKENINLKINSVDLEAQFNAIMDNYKKSAEMASNGVSLGLAQNAKAGLTLNSVLGSTVDDLKELKAKAKELQSTGFVDTSKEIANIDIMLNKYKEFEQELKRQKILLIKHYLLISLKKE